MRKKKLSEETYAGTIKVDLTKDNEILIHVTTGRLQTYCELELAVATQVAVGILKKVEESKANKNKEKKNV